MKNMTSVVRMNRVSPKYQRGISNIQIMVGVLISAILILGGMGMMRYIDKAKVNNDLNELSELKAATVSYGSKHGGNFAGFTQELAIGLDFYNPTRVSGAVGSRTVMNQWKGNITVTPATMFISNDSLAFTYTGIPSSACKDTVMQAGSLAGTIIVGAISVKTSPTNPINEASTVTACDAAADNATVVYSMTK